ncbi:Uncharacterized protein PCOAH_00037320 [Plasmodium coatneyi]|uniref:Uncharacterized protein n=1 Tax=Plasmodium coatneyi TaxID=208452 RepID=A0A1B1E4L3_9APIC|nr:Uncharacterized protein PCOAH_00037320 [Plasmodium coatneyi]ANQ09917.1 Uncharacterized protein PCOAH_00037320 [Plasmodium coatneyi]
MNLITLLLHVIALTFMFWQSDSLWGMRGPIKRSANRQHISGGELGSSFGRILHEADEVSTEIPMNYTIVYVRIIGYSNPNVYYNDEFDEAEAEEIQQFEFTNKLNRRLNKAIREMASEYADFTQFMDVQWRDKMWSDVWFKYLTSIIQDLQKYLSCTYLPISCVDQISNNLIYLTKKDFKAFLEIVDDKWNEKLNNNDVRGR